jgi:hypothetical protein
MTIKTYMAARRTGTRAGAGPNSRRISVTLPEETFLTLRKRADMNHRGLSGEAARIIDDYLVLTAATERECEQSAEYNAAIARGGA